jgi:hypothetical protein
MRDLLRRWPWLVLYAAATVAEFFAEWAKDVARKRIRGDEDEEVGE